MKKGIFLFFAFFYTVSAHAQKLSSDYATGKLSPGYPAEASLFVENLANVKSISLETGVDSIRFMFGSHQQDEQEGYWAILIHNKRRYYESVPLEQSASSGMLAHDISFTFDNGSKKVFTRVLYNPESEEVFYQWLDQEGNVSKIARVEQIARVIAKDQPIPQFTVETLEGRQVSVEDLRGKYVVINWWATTCAPCVLEMPGLNKMVEKFRSRTDVEFMAIADDKKEKLEKFLAKRDFNYRQTLANPDVASIFGNSWPKHIVVNPQGVVTYFFVGGYADIYQDIEKHLNEQLGN